MIVFGRGVKLLSGIYVLAGVFVALEIFGVWGDFALSTALAKGWKIYFSFCNIIAGLMLLLRGRTTQLVFVVILLAQLAVYVMWADALEYQAATLSFYFLTLVFYFVLLTRRFQRLPV